MPASSAASPRPHHGDGVADLLRGGWHQRLLHQRIVLQIQPPALQRLACGLEHRAYLCAIRHHPDSARQRIDHQIHLPELLADDVDGLLAHGVGEGIPDQVDGDATGLLRRLTKPDVVVPASTAEPLVGGTPLERDAQGIGPGAEGERDPGRQPETGRCPQHQHPFRPVERPRRPHLFDLLQHGGATTHGVAIAGNTTLDLGMNDHEGLSGASVGHEKRP